MVALGQGLPRPPPMFWPWVVVGAVAQVGATLLMLAAMTDRSFVVVYAYIKTEPVQVALFGLVFLGDAVTPVLAAAIVTATAGVVMMAIKRDTPSSLMATLLGLAAGAMFALSAAGFRGAILRLDGSSYVMAATLTVVVGLMLQSVFLSFYLRLRNPGVLTVIMRAWRPSLFCGVHGRARLTVLVPRVRACDCRERAHAGTGRGAIRASDFAIRIRAEDEPPGRRRYRSDCDRRDTCAVGAVIGRAVPAGA